MLRSTERQLEPRAQPLALADKFVVPYSSCTPSQTAPKTCCKNTQVLQAFFPSLRTGDLTSKPKLNSYFHLPLIKYLFSWLKKKKKSEPGLLRSRKTFVFLLSRQVLRQPGTNKRVVWHFRGRTRCLMHENSRVNPWSSSHYRRKGAKKN